MHGCCIWHVLEQEWGEKESRFGALQMPKTLFCKKKYPKITCCYLVHKLAFMTHQTLTFNTFEAAFLKGCYVVNAVVERVNSFV